METRVCKFGGSSVADAGQMRKVRAIIDAEASRRFVVPSAPGKRTDDDIKITDLLYRVHAAADSGASIDSLFDQIADRYRQIVIDLADDFPSGPGPAFSIDLPLAEVYDEIQGGAGADYAASRGEYLSGVILSNLLDRPLIDPADMIRFDSQGRFLPEETQAAVSDRLSKQEFGVIPGFYGARPNGAIKTFSRGGSDITGAIVARGVHADVYENWTDVSGLLMTDPRIVDSPRTIPELTYRELRELAYMGATVLHEEAIFPVREVGIPIHIRNTNDPEAPGTRIASDGLDMRPTGRITGLAGRKDFTILALEKTLMNAEIGFGRKLLAVLEEHEISWEHMPSGIDTLSVVVKSDVAGDRLDALVADIQLACDPDAIEIHPGIALIATVGRGMSHAPGTAAQLFGALAKERINIRMIDQGSSELNIIVGVENADFERTVRTIYNAFVSSD